MQDHQEDQQAHNGTEDGYDPYDEDRGFGYRLARPGDRLRATRPPGERPLGDRTVLMPEPKAGGDVELPAGQPLVWSVGPDGIDQGGTSAPVGAVIVGLRPPDLVYLVPLGPYP